MKKLIIGFAIISAGAFSFIGSGNQVYGQATVEPIGSETTPCWNCIKTKNGSQVRYCGTCDWVDNATDCFWTWESKCTPIPN